MNAKFMTRALTLALVIIMAVSILPMAALAKEPESIFPDYDDELNERTTWGSIFILDDATQDYEDFLLTSDGNIGGIFVPVGEVGTKKVTFKPAKFVEYEGEYYDLEGVDIIPDYVLYGVLGTDPKPSDVDKANKWLEKHFPNGDSSITIPKIPDPVKNEKAFEDWIKQYGGLIIAIYGPHQHTYSCWIPDNNNHWTKCLVCEENFLLMNWHYDNDEDDWCDVCGHEIIYYDISIKETEGVKVTVSGDRDMTAPYRDMITVKVEAEDGYRVEDVRVWKIRENGTKDQITRKIVKRGSDYEFEMQNFDCEIVAKVVKQK